MGYSVRDYPFRPFRPGDEAALRPTGKQVGQVNKNQLLFFLRLLFMEIIIYCLYYWFSEIVGLPGKRELL
jgi:hypothetical protein